MSKRLLSVKTIIKKTFISEYEKDFPNDGLILRNRLHIMPPSCYSEQINRDNDEILCKYYLTVP